MNEDNNSRLQSWRESGKTIFFALIAEMDLVIKNLINIFLSAAFSARWARRPMRSSCHA